MSPVSCLPAYFVFGQQHLDVATCAERLATYAADKAHGPEHRTLLVFLDQVLLHSITQLQEHIQSIQQVSQFMATPDAHTLANAYCTVDTCQHPTMSCTLFQTQSAFYPLCCTSCTDLMPAEPPPTWLDCHCRATPVLCKLSLPTSTSKAWSRLPGLHSRQPTHLSLQHAPAKQAATAVLRSLLQTQQPHQLLWHP